MLKYGSWAMSGTAGAWLDCAHTQTDARRITIIAAGQRNMPEYARIRAFECTRLLLLA
jgi:hypothetical protein